MPSVNEDRKHHAMSGWIDIQKHFYARSLEWFGGLSLLSWGAYVILHPGMFDIQPLFAGLKSMASQETWGLMAFSCGMIRLVSLYINGRWGLTPWIRIATSFMSIFVWFWVSVGLFKLNVANTGLVIYPAFLLADMFSAYRAAGDAYEAEVMKRLNQLSESCNVTSFTRSR